MVYDSFILQHSSFHNVQLHLRINVCKNWVNWFLGIKAKKVNHLTPVELLAGWIHDDLIKWKHLPRYWPFVRGIHRSPVNSPHKGQWCGALMFSLICVWINDWVNNREAGDLIPYRAHYDVTVMFCGHKSLLFWRGFTIRKWGPVQKLFWPADLSSQVSYQLGQCTAGVHTAASARQG